MPKDPIKLFTAAPATGGMRSLADLLSQQQPVNLSDISDMPAPDTTRPTRQQLRTERFGVEAQLDSVLYLIRMGEDNPQRYAETLTELRRDRDRYELRLEEIRQALGDDKGKQAA
jgi:hypothetical protein